MTSHAVPDEVHAELARLLVGAGITTRHTPLSPLPGGRDNHLYTTSAAGRRLVVKIPRGRRVRYAVAAWTAARLTAAGLPAPTVLGHSELLCVETRCPGQPLSDPSGPPVDCDVAVAAGRLLRRLHAVPVTGFGRLDTTGVGLRPSLSAWLVQLRALPAAADRDMHALVAQVRQVLRHHANLLPVTAARLLHGDWTARHVIADAGTITGIVDLESVRGGDPLADLAGWSLQEPADLTAALFAGYFPTPPDQPTSTVLALYRLRIAAALLADHLARHDADEIRLRIAQLDADLADLCCGQPAAIPRVTPATH